MDGLDNVKWTVNNDGTIRVEGNVTLKLCECCTIEYYENLMKDAFAQVLGFDKEKIIVSFIYSKPGR